VAAVITLKILENEDLDGLLVVDVDVVRMMSHIQHRKQPTDIRIVAETQNLVGAFDCVKSLDRIESELLDDLEIYRPPSAPFSSHSAKTEKNRKEFIFRDYY
jgi:hypothetical protein